MHFGYTILYVDDVQEAVAFYERAFGLTRGMVHENEYGELATGATKLAFVSRTMVREHFGLALAEAGSAPPPFEIALVSEEVQAAYEHAVATGAVAVKAPVLMPWGQMVSYVRDLNGFLVELCSPVEPPAP